MPRWRVVGGGRGGNECNSGTGVFLKEKIKLNRLSDGKSQVRNFWNRYYYSADNFKT